MILKNEKTIHRQGNLATWKKKRKQNGGFLGAIVGPIAAQVGAQLFGGLAYKILGRRRKKKKISEKNKKKNKTSLENANQKQYFVKKKSPSEKSRIATWTSFLCEV